MRTSLRSSIILGIACACSAPQSPGPPARLSVGPTDSIIVNNVGSTPLAVHAIDASGHALASPVHFTWIGGDSLSVSATGLVDCSRRGDVVVRAEVQPLSSTLTVRCRPVAYLRIPGPLQFVLGDSDMSKPVAIPLQAFDKRGRPVVTFAGAATVDTTVATLEGLTLSPRARGISVLSAQVGDRDTRIGVHVYQRVASLASIDTLLRVVPNQRLFAVPLRLKPGEYERRRLPPGPWMLAMLPEDDSSASGIHLRVENARCTAHLLNTPRRFGCRSDGDASIVLYRSFSSPADRSMREGYLLVRWTFQ